MMTMRELDERVLEIGGQPIHVRLLWNSETDSLWLSGDDGSPEPALLVFLRADQAVDAMQHPALYLRREPVAAG